MKVLFLFLVLVLSLGVEAQLLQPTKLSPEELSEDFAIFKEVLLEAHPHPHRFLNPSEFEAFLAAQADGLKDSLNQIEFFQVLSSAMSKVGEGHSSVGLSDSLKSWMKTQARLLPFEVHFYDKRAFIAKDDSNFQNELLGFEIKSINDLSMEDIMHRIDSISCLGTVVNQSRTYGKLSILKNFPLAYFLFVDQARTFRLQLGDLEGEEKSVEVQGNAIDFEVRFTQELEEPYPPYTINIDTPRSLATIKISTFAHWVHNLKFKDYEKFYQVAFEVLDEAGIEHLVIDVRNNRGGHEYLGAQLLTYLIDEPFFLESSIFAKNTEFPLLDSLKIDYQLLGEKAFQRIDTGFLVKESIVMGLMKPEVKHPYQGQVYFLTNGNCFSACNIFVALADFHDAGIILGEETGGIYQDTDGYFEVKYTLPHSGLKPSFRLMHIKTAVKRDEYGRGVYPDIPIQPTIQDILGRKDVMMEKVYQLIQKK